MIATSSTHYIDACIAELDCVGMDVSRLDYENWSVLHEASPLPSGKEGRLSMSGDEQRSLIYDIVVGQLQDDPAATHMDPWHIAHMLSDCGFCKAFQTSLEPLCDHVFEHVAAHFRQ